MEIPVSLQPRKLIKLNFPALAAHFKRLVLENPSAERVNDLDARIRYLVDSEAIPGPVYPVWLQIAVRYSSGLFRASLLNPDSCAIRRAGIIVLLRSFHSRKWKQQGWDALGGARGIFSILNQLPLVEVRSALLAITSCKHMPDRAVIATCMEELFTLLSDGTSSRPLEGYAKFVLPLCSSERLLQVIAKQSETGLRRELTPLTVRLHVDLLRRITVGSCKVPPSTRIWIIKEFAAQLVDFPDLYHPVHIKSTPVDAQAPGLAFCRDLIAILQGDEELKNLVSGEIRYCIEVAVTVAVRRKIAFDHILSFLESALPDYLITAASNPFQFTLIGHLMGYWSIAKYGRVGDKGRFARGPIKKTHASRPNKRHASPLESLLIRIMQDHEDSILSSIKSGSYRPSFPNMLSELAPEARIDFLRLACRYSESLNFDLDASPPCDREKALIPGWHPEILEAFADEDAQILFGRSLTIWGCEEFLPDQPQGDGKSYYLEWPKQCKLKVGWESRRPPAEDDFAFTRRVFDELRRRAERERDANSRGPRVVDVVSIACKSLSIDIFQGLLEWAERYVRDPFVFPQFLNHVCRHSIDLLSCVAFPEARRPKSLPELVARVGASNRALEKLIELIRLRQQEPGAYGRGGIHPVTVQQFLSSIIEKRMKAWQQYEKAGLGTAAELAATLLEASIPVLVDYERLGINLTNRGYDLRDGGCLSHFSCPEKPTESIVRFLDQLAQQRDLLWGTRRAADNPDVLGLEPGLPRGLPIQALLPTVGLAQAAMEHPHAAPFIVGRINEILFSPPDVLSCVLPNDTSPVVFVDSLKYAITAHLGIGPKETKIARAQQVWDHYTHVLEGHPDREPLLRTLTSLGIDVIPEVAARSVITAAYLDEAVMPGEVLEWNLLGSNWANTSSDTSKRAAITLLEARLNQRGSSYVNPTRSTAEAHVSPLNRVWPFTEVARGIGLMKQTFNDRFRKLPLESRDATALSVILLFDGLVPDTRILQKSFPSEETLRYPALFLDDQFFNLKPPGITISHVVDIADKFLPYMPAILLRDLAGSLLNSLLSMDGSSDTYNTHFSHMLVLIKLLMRSDKPEYAVDLALQVILSFPDKSSYHRQLNLASLGERLRPEESVSLIRQFVTSVSDGLRQQAKSKDEGAEVADHRPRIKITTAKMVAAILVDMDFLPRKALLEIIQELFSATAHIDVRTACIKSLFSLLERGVASAEVYQALLSLTPLIVGPSERKQLTEEDWVAADTGGLLPDVDSMQDRPLLAVFIDEASKRIPDEQKADYVQQVLLPSLDQSTEHHLRWIRVFLAQIEFPNTIATSSFPFGAFDPRMVDKILKSFKWHLPSSFLLRHRSFALAHLQYPVFDAITNRLSAHDPNFRQTNAGIHWIECLSVYRCPAVFEDFSTHYFSHPRVADGLTLQHFLDETSTRAAIVARSPLVFNSRRSMFVRSPSLLTGLLRSLRLGRERGYAPKIREVRYRAMQSTMEKIVSEIENIRREADIEHADILPSTFQLKKSLLPPPEVNPTVEEPMREFVAQLLELLRAHVDDLSLITDGDDLKDTVSGVTSNREKCAVLIGDIDDSEAESSYGRLRVHLAQTLIMKVSDDKLLDDELNGMVQRWKQSPSEFIRRVGWNIDGSF